MEFRIYKYNFKQIIFIQLHINTYSDKHNWSVLVFEKLYL